MIQLSDITKVYKNSGNLTPVLSNVSLMIEDGETVAVMGASGSGKTTLLNIIGCMDTPTSGTYLYGDTPVHALNRTKTEHFRKEHICFIFQQFALLNDYTVYENVELPLRARNIPLRQRKKMVMDCLEQVGIADLAKKLPTKISGGQQQRCAIARALVSGCDIVLADEPTGALDSKTGQEIMDILLGLSSQGKTVILVTHDENIAKRAGRIIRITDGRLTD